MHYYMGFSTLLLAALLFCAASQRADRTLEEGATGEDVVIATVNKISESGIFQDDHQFLRRMAYVETNFGETMTPGSGGIWNVSENVFRVVTRVILLSLYRPYGELFKSSFGNETVVIDNCLRVCNRQKLDVPLYSALSVMVYIDALGHMIEDNIIQQAQLWKLRFRPSIDADVFIEKARILLNQLPPSSGEETVIATVNKIAGSEIFPNDFQFLKRMAYIETNYGKTATPGSGGIWAVSEDVFRVVTTVIVAALPQFKTYGELFESSFGFKWNETVVIDDCSHVCNRQRLDVPLYSALSVMVYIEVLRRMIEDSITQQAQLWKELFKSDSPDINAEFFIEKAHILLNQLPPSCTYLEREETVIATVNKIAGSGIFPNDFQFLKRMAYIETNYGQTATPGDGGIWAIA